MLRTALLLVLVMAGSPAGSLACELWCNSPAGEEPHLEVGCDDASQSGPAGQEIGPSVAGCHNTFAMAPFVVEVRQAESTPAGAAAALFDTKWIAPDNNETAAGGCVFEIQPPRPTSSRAVLRV